MSSALSASIRERIAKLLPVLSSDKPGEVVATAAAIGRTLTSSGSDWHDLARHIGLDPQPREIPTWSGDRASGSRSVAANLQTLREALAAGVLSQWERGFCASIFASAAADRNWRPSEKQQAVIGRLASKIWGVYP